MASATEEHPIFEYRLDNSAKIYIAQHSKSRTTMMRIGVYLDKPINVSLMEKAFAQMFDRCPYYNIHLRRGLFWYYLEHHEKAPRVEAESKYPCLYIPLKWQESPFRLIAYRNRICLEVSHYITDGYGCLQFLHGIVMAYLRLQGHEIDPQGLVIDTGDPMEEGEFEESFLKNYHPDVPKTKMAPPALQFVGMGLRYPAFNVFEGIIDSNALRTEAKKHGVTIGDFLTALLIDVCYEEMKARKKRPHPIRISVPVNVRGFFGSKTMRNFTLTAEPGIDPRLGDFTFEEIIKKVHHYMRLELDHRDIRRQISRNVGSERKMYVRVLPLFIKVPALKFFYTKVSSLRSTLTFSNLGRVNLPEAMIPLVKSYQFIPPPHKRSRSVTSIAYNGKTHIVFGSTLRDRSLETRFFRKIRKMGIAVSIRTNRS